MFTFRHGFAFTLLVTTLSLVVGVAGLLMLSQLPAWRLAGTQSLPLMPVNADNGTDLCPPPGAIIELRGDSHVSGGRMGSAPGQPYGKVLEALLGEERQVVLNARGGATAAEGLRRLAPVAPRADLVILAFGTNDAAPRGWLSGKRPVPLDDFVAALEQQITAAQNRGAAVALLAPPPAGSVAINRRLAPYREAVSALAERRGIHALDPSEAFAGCADSQPVLVRDALHLNAAGHRCLGQWLARRLCPAATHSVSG